MARADRDKLKITKENFYVYFDEKTLEFQNIIGANTAIVAPKRTTRSKNTYSQVAFLYPSDIVKVMEKRIDKHKNKPQMNIFKIKWEHTKEQAKELLNALQDSR